MPVPPQGSYPGVYVEEVSGGPGPIEGVPTSVTAFIGRALRGPVEEPVTINNMGAFARHFGGLEYDFPMSYAVRDFFEAGGTEAVVVRLFSGGEPAVLPVCESAPWVDQIRGTLRDAVRQAVSNAGGQRDALQRALRDLGARLGERPLEARVVTRILNAVLAEIDGLDGDAVPAGLETRIFEVIAAGGGEPKALFALTAANPGAWANQLHAWVDDDGVDADAEARFAAEGLKAEHLFNLHLALVDGRGQILEREDHNGVTTKPRTSRTLELVLKNESMLARTTHTDEAGTRPPETAGGRVDKTVKDSAPLAIGDYANPEDCKGFNAFDKADIINLMSVPPDQRGGDTHPAVYAAAVAYVRTRRAFLIVDGPSAWDTQAIAGDISKISPHDVKISGELAQYAGAYFPRVNMADPQKGGTIHTFPVSGTIAGLYARTDATRGVWKAPAGMQVGINGIDSLTHKLTDAENGQLNPLGINCLRTFPTLGTVVWGARTLAGADQTADEYTYVPVRRTALFIAESLYRGTQWAVFEPNDQPLWAQLRFEIGSFMSGLFRQGAFQGGAAKDAYFVRCDASTTTQTDIDLGIVNVVVGFAPLKPGEFVVLYIQQKAGANESVGGD